MIVRTAAPLTRPAPHRASAVPRQEGPAATPRPDRREWIRTGVEAVAVLGAAGRAGWLGAASTPAGALGPGFAGITAGLGVIQILEGLETKDRRFFLQGATDIGLGLTGLVGGPAGAALSLGLLAARLAQTAVAGSPFAS